MPFVLIFIALVLAASAYQNTQGTLLSALWSDAQGFGKWFAALALLVGLQWVPGMTTVARWLTGLVVLVLVLTRWQQILAGFTDLTSGTAPAAAQSPGAAYSANPNAPQITQASVAGVSSSPGSATSSTAVAANTGQTVQTAPTATSTAPSFAPYDPRAVMAPFASFVFDAAALGFGGTA